MANPYERRNPQVNPMAYRDNDVKREFRQIGQWPEMTPWAFTDAKITDPLDGAPWRRLPEVKPENHGTGSLPRLF